MSREENKEIFQDTEKLCKTNPLLIQAWKSSSKLQKLILENEAVTFEKQIYEKSANVIVSKKRTFVTNFATNVPNILSVSVSLTYNYQTVKHYSFSSCNSSALGNVSRSNR